MTPSSTLRLLIVEDEPGDACLMRLALRKNGFAIHIHGASDGRDALRFLRREDERFRDAGRPDLILLDLKMPGQSGLECLATLKQDNDLRAIPVVIVTTSMLEADVQAAYQLGAAGYVLKPTDLNEFMATIKTLGAYWFQLVRLPAHAE